MEEHFVGKWIALEQVLALGNKESFVNFIDGDGRKPIGGLVGAPVAN